MSQFRFKQFSVSHESSSMKVGVDSILLGSWADVSQAQRILDVGTGCGLLALMCAQRNPTAVIDAIDIDRDSIEEASKNFKESPWGDRLSAKLQNFIDFIDVFPKYDLIISNPPYFNSGIKSPISSRMVARHIDSLSSLTILKEGGNMLTNLGIIAMVIPSDQVDTLTDYSEEYNLKLRRILYIRGNERSGIKRVLIEFQKRDDEIAPEFGNLLLKGTDNNATEEFRALCSDFYLNI